MWFMINLQMMFFLTNSKLLNTVLANTGAIKGTSRKKLYQESGLEYLQQRRWMRHLCLFYKIVSTKLPAYIYDSIPPARQSQRHPNTFKFFSLKKNVPCIIDEWNSYPEIHSSASYNIFWKSLLNFIGTSFFFFTFFLSPIWSPYIT